MILNELILSFDFGDVFPYIANMYPNAKRHRKEIKKAFDIMSDMKHERTNRCIKYKLIEESNRNNYYFGADDSDFKADWETLLGMEIKKIGNVDLIEEEILANCLLNAIFIGKHPKEFDAEYDLLTRA